MKVLTTAFPGVLIIEPVVYHDNRGLFLEGFNHHRYQESGIPFEWVQDNLSASVRGVVRGLHFQKDPAAQTKLVQVVHGCILDVILDIRLGSPTFGKHISIELDAQLRRQILIPRGFAHGFSVLSQTAEVMYKTDAYYSKTYEAGILFNDPDLKIDWGISAEDYLVSPRDRAMPPLCNLGYAFE
ncbi:MAG: dTDP-4-dehydrorhamnose 3,5-epimerase [Bacteroidetes bacterium]|nr:dTDP-4-dehydrorhamnose 3,5-epimerase [Bacteroidota bacterium]